MDHLNHEARDIEKNQADSLIVSWPHAHLQLSSKASWTPIFGGAMPNVRGNSCKVGPPAFPL